MVILYFLAIRFKWCAIVCWHIPAKCRTQEFRDTSLPKNMTCLHVFMLFVNVGRDSDSLRAGRSGDRIPVEVRFSALVQTGPGAHPASYTMGTGSFPGGKAAGPWC
jgi:hypothetical protein